MAFAAKDGKKFSNADTMRSHNAMTSVPRGTPEMGNMQDEEPQEQDGEQIAAEHGPAMETHTQHDHEMGVHHVHSIHPDGHEHHSDHASHEEAHEHAKKLSSPGHEESEPEGEAEAEEESAGKTPHRGF